MTNRTIVVTLLGLALCLASCSGEGTTGRDAPDAMQGQPQELVVNDTMASDVPQAPITDPESLAGMLAAGNVSSIRVLGDSITAGYLIDGFDGPSDTGVVVYQGGEGTYQETPTTVACWTNAFRAYARERGVERFVNAGVSGFRMQYLAEEPDAWLGEGADVIVVMLGTNDAAKVSVEDFGAYAEQALTSAEARCQHLVVISPPTNDRNDAVNLYGMEQIDQILNDLCASHDWEHVSLLDVLTVGSDDFFEDQVHPTASGSAKLWDALRDQLNLA